MQEPEPVCCTACSSSIDTFVPFKFPPALMLRHRPQLCNATPEQPPPSLAAGARVPVVHTPDGTDVRVGTWFYWAPGCSGVTWPLGKPLIALNAMDAAIRLQRLDDGDQRHSDDARRAAAVRRLAALVLRHDGGMASAALKLIQRVQGEFTATVVEFVERASRLRPCTRAAAWRRWTRSRSPCRAARRWRSSGTRTTRRCCCGTATIPWSCCSSRTTRRAARGRPRFGTSATDAPSSRARGRWRRAGCCARSTAAAATSAAAARRCVGAVHRAVRRR